MVDALKSHRPVGSRRRMLLQLVFALVIFLSGTVIGVGGTMQLVKSQGGRIRPPRDEGRRGPDPNELVTRWTEEYALTADQGEKIKGVLERVDQIRREAFSASRAKMDAAYTEMVEGMRGIMTPEQFTKWNEELQKRPQWGSSKDGSRRGGHRGGGPRGEFDPNRKPPEGPRPPEMRPPGE